MAGGEAILARHAQGALALLLSLSPALAEAHPMGGTPATHRGVVTISADAVTVDWTTLVPTHDILQELGPGRTLTPGQSEAFTAGKLAELADNLRLEVDGAALRWTPVPSDTPTGLANSRIVTYTQTLRAPLPPEARSLRISNGNYPDQPSLFQWELSLEDGLRLSSTSLLDVARGRVTANRHGQWRMDEPSRELTLVLEPRPSPAVKALAEAAGLADAAPTPCHEALGQGPYRAVQGVLAAGVLALIGAGVALWRRQKPGPPNSSQAAPPSVAPPSKP
ncbi:MAG: hypothetical protein H6739_00700 [Alphaproteobacteria bacterium]|nr:hypothetical protein [Alphaproteobacteria bacterium]